MKVKEVLNKLLNKALDKVLANFLVVCLTFCFSVYSCFFNMPFQIFGQSSGQVFAKSKLKISNIAIVPISSASQVDPLLLPTIQVLKDEFKIKGAYSVIDPRKSNIKSRRTKQQSLSLILKKAEDLYYNFSFRQAAKMLNLGIKNYRKKSYSYDSAHLLNAYYALANIHLGAGDLKQARKAFEQAWHLAPKQQPDPNKFPPKTIRLYQKVLEDLAKNEKRTVSVTVAVRPNSAVIKINGVSYLSGQKLALGLGEHYLEISHPDYRSKFEKLKLKGTQKRLSFNLQRQTKKNDLLFVKAPTLRDQNAIVSGAQDIGRSLQVPVVIAVALSKVGWNYKLDAYLVDVNQGTLMAKKSIEIPDVKAEMRSAGHILATHFNQFVGASDKRLANSDVIILGKKKSIVKSPAFWVLIGVLVVGGGVGVAMAGKGGDSGPGVSLTDVSSGGLVPQTP